jgi:tRNA threonylcarbamoyladenosine modification (KEOPS) complex  Pcc1 subunit
MPAGGYDMVCEQGATFSRVFTWADENEVPVDLTGYTARMHVRTAVGTATTTIELTTANSRITLGGAAGTITLQLTATDTAALAAKRYVYDLELVSGATVTRLLQGAFTVSPEVTR